MRRLLAALPLLFLYSCAHKGAPGGGPEDKVPPQVTETVPAADSLNVPLDRDIRVRFTKWIDPRSAQKAVFVSPAVPRMVVSVSGRELALEPAGPLLDSTTYVVTLGTDIADFYGNKLIGSHTFAFSTGGHLDSCVLSGLVMGEDGRKLSSYTVGAYLMADTLPIDPMRTPPVYLTQSGADGAYSLSGLRTGAYRLFAFNDANQNRRYNPDRERLGLPPSDYTLSNQAPRAADIVLVPAMVDTHPLFLKKVNSLPGKRIKVFFSKAVRLPLPGEPGRYFTVSSADSLISPIETLSISSLIPDPTDSAAFQLLTSPVAHGRKYALSACSLWAADGFPLDSARRSLPFLGNGKADTTAPEIASSLPRSGAREVLLSDSVRLFFSEPVRGKEALEGFGLYRAAVTADTADSVIRSDTAWTSIPGRGILVSPMELAFRPDTLDTGFLCEWRLKPRKLIDLAGCFSPDSGLKGRFFTIKEPGTARLSGRLCCPGAENGRVVLLTMSGKKMVETAADNNGYYRMSGLAEGAYRLIGYIDANRNGRPDRGGLFPFAFAEKGFVVADSVALRERWEVEDADFSCGPAGKGASDAIGH